MICSAASRSRSKSSSDRQRSMFSRVARSIVASGSPRYDCRSGSLTAPVGTSARLRAARTAARSFARSSRRGSTECLRLDHLRVRTIDPADHRPALRVVPVGLEHGNHLRHGNRQQSAPASAARWPLSRSSPILQVGGAAAPAARHRDGTARSSSRSTPTGAPARQRKQASPGPPAADQLGIDRNLIGVQGSDHPGPNPPSAAPQPTLADARRAAEGATNEALWQRLFISARRSRRRIQRTSSRVEVDNRTAAADAARRRGWSALQTSCAPAL